MSNVKSDREFQDDLFWHRLVDDLGLADSGSAQTRSHGRGRTWRTTWSLGTVVLGVAAFIGLKAAARELGRILPEVLGNRPLHFYVAVAHLFVLVAIMAAVAAVPPRLTPEVPIARRAWRQFRFGWKCLWASWFALYGWLSVVWGVGTDGDANWAVVGHGVADVLNIGTSFVFFYLFLVLDKPSVKAAGSPERDSSFRQSLLKVLLLCLVVGILSILGRAGKFRLSEDGPLLGSIVGAVAMAFFVGRLSDSHLKVQRALLAPLYFYVALQMFWHLFVGEGTGEPVGHGLLLLLALMLKVYLFAVVTRWMHDGKLQTYFDEVAYPRVPSDLL